MVSLSNHEAKPLTLSLPRKDPQGEGDTLAGAGCCFMLTSGHPTVAA